MKEISWGNKSFYNIMSDAQSNQRLFSVQSVKEDIEAGIDNGSIDEDDIIKAFDGGYITGQDAIDGLNSLFSPLSINKKKNGYNVFKTNIDKELKDAINNIGMPYKTNLKKQYIEDNMKEYLSGGERTDEEILAYADIVEDKAAKRFSKDNEYQTIYTPDWFREKTGYSISAIENAVSEASVSGQLDMKKLKALLLDMTGNDKNQANKIYSMYLAVKNN
jgi:hypothetical protein